MDPARFVFLDETGTATNMTRRYGRCASDQRLVAAGASVLRENRFDGHLDGVVMADPEGNELCVA